MNKSISTSSGIQTILQNINNVSPQGHHMNYHCYVSYNDILKTETELLFHYFVIRVCDRSGKNRSSDLIMTLHYIKVPVFESIRVSI